MEMRSRGCSFGADIKLDYYMLEKRQRPFDTLQLQFRPVNR